MRSKAEMDAWLQGFAVGLASMHRQLIAEEWDPGLCQVAAEAGLTLAEARRVGVMDYDIDRLRLAGVT